MKKTKASDHAHQTGNRVKESDQRIILELLQTGPQTTKSLSAYVGKAPYIITARLALLQAWGMVYDTGQGPRGSTVWALEIDPVLQGKRGREYRKKRHLSRVEGVLKEDKEFTPPYLIHALRRHLDEQETGAGIAAKVLSTPPDKFAGNR